MRVSIALGRFRLESPHDETVVAFGDWSRSFRGQSSERTFASDPPMRWLDAFVRRSTRAREAMTILRGAEQAERLDVPIPVLAESYVHMHINRLFRSEQRAHELVIYDFLSCLYESRLVRPREATGASGRARV